MAGIKQSTYEIEPITKKEIEEMLLGREATLRDRALLSFLYLTGARISEIVPNPIRKWRGVTLSQLEMIQIKGKDYLLFKNIPTEKRKGMIIFRNLPVNYQKNKLMIDIIDAYASELIQLDSSVLFPITRQRAWQIVKKFSKAWYCHLLRHYRLSHLVTEHNYSDAHLRQFTGWADSRPATYYIHLGYQDLAEKDA